MYKPLACRQQLPYNAEVGGSGGSVFSHDIWHRVGSATFARVSLPETLSESRAEDSCNTSLSFSIIIIYFYVVMNRHARRFR